MDKIVVGKVVKENLGKLEEDIREIFSRQLIKYLTGVTGRLIRMKRYLVRFEYGFKKELSSNKLTTTKEERSPETEE